MPNDESLYDTQRLIAGAEASGLYSLEDIIEEFSEGEGEKRQPAPPPPPPTQEPVEYYPESESEIADAIAHAVAASFAGEEDFGPEPAPEDGDGALPPEEPEEYPEPEEDLDDDSAGPENDGEDPFAVPVFAPGENGRPAPRTPASVEPEQSPGPGEPAGSDVQANAPKPRRRGDLPPTEPAVPRVSTLEVIGQMLSELQARRRSDLPESRASLKAAEKGYSLISRILSLISPVRYLVMLLTLLMILSRSVGLLAFGFLTGSTGILVAVILTVLGMLASWHGVLESVRDMIYLRIGFSSALLLATLLSILEALLHQNESTYLPFLTMAWCLVGSADLMNCDSKLQGLRAIIAGKKRTGVRVAEGLLDGEDCIGKTASTTVGYVRRQEEPDGFRQHWIRYTPFLVILILILGAFISARMELSYLTVLATLFTLALPGAAAVSAARPVYTLSKSLGPGAAVAGWTGMRRLGGRKTVLIYDRDLFPQGTISHRGVKVYGSLTPVELVSCGASLVFQAESNLTEPFAQLLGELGGQTLPVRYFRVTEGGLTGYVGDVFVSLGTYNFTQLMGAIPPRDAPKNGLYICINGQIEGLFAIKYVIKAGSASGFRRMVREWGLTPLAAMKNLSVNPQYMQRWFQIPVGGVLCPKVDTRWSLAEPGLMSRGTVCGFTVAEGVQPYSQLVVGARRTYRTGLFLTVLSVLASLALLILTVWQLLHGQPVLAELPLLLGQILFLVLTEVLSRVAVR